MDPTGKVVWAKHNEIQAANVKVASGTQHHLIIVFHFVFS
jgi:hypothetical protein